MHNYVKKELICWYFEIENRSLLWKNCRSGKFFGAFNAPHEIQQIIHFCFLFLLLLLSNVIIINTKKRCLLSKPCFNVLCLAVYHFVFGLFSVQISRPFPFCICSTSSLLISNLSIYYILLLEIHLLRKQNH